MSQLRKVGIIGDTGMVGQELDRILSLHSSVEVEYRQNSRRKEGNSGDCEVIFLATKDPESMAFAPGLLAEGSRVIDMSGAFRLPRDLFEAGYALEHTAPELLKAAIYGMPALYAKEIAQAQLVANPGCYPTSVILALRPLKDLLQGEATVVATSGNSGARQEVEEAPNELTYSYGKRHKHVPEMALYSGFPVNFTPIVLRSVFAGINANIRVELVDELKQVNSKEAEAQIRHALSSAYGPDDLVQVVEDTPDEQWGTRDVVGTHKLLIKVGVDEGFVYLCSLEDNLGKGAASQAVENMNIMLGFSRLEGIGEVYGIA
jgi:N-acetyl-gamma-glutamyl-phosphate reductase